VGLDLSLLVVDGDTPGVTYSHSMLACDHDGELFARVLHEEETGGTVIEPTFHSFRSRDDTYEESHYGVTTETAYGEPLKWVFARDLVECFESSDGLSSWNAAVRAFLQHLHPTTRVALFWR